jgi:ADP-ribose pyrophosphatase YjhB (NUDIX family)
MKKRYTIKLKAGVVVRHQGKVLLIRERNNRLRRYRWNIIKGTFEPGIDASIVKTAIREAREEAGAKIAVRHLLATYFLLDKTDAIMLFVFVADLIGSRARVAPQKLQAKNEHVVEARFFTRRELARLQPKDFVGMRGYLAIRDYLKGTIFSLNVIKTLPPMPVADV